MAGLAKLPPKSTGFALGQFLAALGAPDAGYQKPRQVSVWRRQGARLFVACTFAQQSEQACVLPEIAQARLKVTDKAILVRFGVCSSLSHW